MTSRKPILPVALGGLLLGLVLGLGTTVEGAIVPGAADCSTGLAKKIHDAFVADHARFAFPLPLSAAAEDWICSLSYNLANEIGQAHNSDIADGGSGGGVATVSASTPLSSSGGANPIITHDTSGISAGACAYPSSITFTASGHASSCSAGSAPVTSVGGSSPIASSGGATPTISLNASGVVAASYTNASVTVDTYGRITAASSGTAPVTSVGGSSPISSSGGATPTISHGNSGVGAGSYTYASFTVDAMGHLSAASSGTAPVTSVSGSSPISSSGGTTPTISHATIGSSGTYAYPTSVTADSYGHLSSITAGAAPFSSQDTTVASDGSAVSPGGCTEYSNYGSWSVTTTARTYILATTIDFVPSNAADYVNIGVLIDGSSYTSYEGRYYFTAGQLGSRIRVTFHTRVALSAASHTFKVCWGTAASGYVETDGSCVRSFTLWSVE